MMPPLEHLTLTCPGCGKKLLDAGVLTARVIKLGTSDSRARCNRCKRWIVVPVAYAPPRMISR